MNRQTLFAAVMLLLSSGCSTFRDSCSTLRHYRQFDLAPVARDAKTLEPAALPAEVQRAANLYMLRDRLDPARHKSPEEALRDWPDPADRRHFPIIKARDEGRYILLEIQNPFAFDANAFAVYSKARECVVGWFAWRPQG